MTKSYTNPLNVKSPKWAKINIEEVIIDTGYNGFSVARLWYEEILRIGIRWNGTEKYIGMPSAMGNPTWFLIPNELMEDIESKARDLITDKVDKIAGIIKKAVSQKKEENSNEYSVSLTSDIHLNETEKNELKKNLEEHRIYFPNNESCCGTSTKDNTFSYNVFYIN